MTSTKERTWLLGDTETEKKTQDAERKAITDLKQEVGKRKKMQHGCRQKGTKKATEMTLGVYRKKKPPTRNQKVGKN